MPKKSNKTAHVLSLLTNSNDETTEIPSEKTNLEQKQSQNLENSSQNFDSNSTSESTKSEVIIELQDSSQSEQLSNLVKSDLEKELNNQLNTKINKTFNSNPSVENKNTKLVEESNDTSERPPYSQTFIDKFSIENTTDDITENENSAFTNTINSKNYILQNFDEENEDNSMKVQETFQSNNSEPIETNMSERSNIETNNTKILHNFAEDIIKAKAPVIMKNLKMCTCQDCINDVTALTLNHTKPLYTVTEKGQLYQKLTAYEHQYGTDLASQITKACVKVKLNPRHSKKNRK